jgi:hypothetical protein
MTHSEIASLILAQKTIEEQFAVWAQYYDILKTGRGIYTYDDNNCRNKEIYSGYTSSDDSSEITKKASLYNKMYGEAYLAFANRIFTANTYQEKINRWVEYMDLHTLQFMHDDMVISVVPEGCNEIKIYNDNLYEWNLNYFFREKHSTLDIYYLNDYESRIERLINQLKNSPYYAHVISSTIEEIITYFTKNANDKTKTFFKSLMKGIPVVTNEKIWPFDGSIIYYIHANEAFEFLCAIEQTNNYMITDAF